MGHGDSAWQTTIGLSQLRKRRRAFAKLRWRQTGMRLASQGTSFGRDPIAHPKRTLKLMLATMIGGSTGESKQQAFCLGRSPYNVLIDVCSFQAARKVTLGVLMGR